MKIFNGVILVQGIPFVMFSSFICIFIGLLLGRITIKGVSLGSAGVFIIALIYGALFSDHLSSTVSQKYKGEKIDISSNALKIIENIGLIFLLDLSALYQVQHFLVILKKILSLIFYQD
jgi:putative transport protein